MKKLLALLLLLFLGTALYADVINLKKGDLYKIVTLTGSSYLVMDEPLSIWGYNFEDSL